MQKIAQFLWFDIKAVGGQVIFPLDDYDWGLKYAWVIEEDGLSRQIDVNKTNNQQKILPTLLFLNDKLLTVKDANGKTELVVETETNEEYQKMFETAWPKASQRLKALLQKSHNCHFDQREKSF
ncbi:MAG TPA: hypothetical protein VK870_01695 [Ignavibacteriaceae bacterium]|nr:hypothetical protein [Ignavibacteriaceae bacterium]